MPDRLFDWRVVARGQALASATVLTVSDLDLQMLDAVVALNVLLAGSGPDVKIEYAEGKQRSVGDTIDYDAYQSITASATGTTMVTFPFPTVLGRFLSLRFTGNGGNGANTTIEADLICREKV